MDEGPARRTNGVRCARVCRTSSRLNLHPAFNAICHLVHGQRLLIPHIRPIFFLFCVWHSRPSHFGATLTFSPTPPHTLFFSFMFLLPSPSTRPSHVSFFLSLLLLTVWVVVCPAVDIRYRSVLFENALFVLSPLECCELPVASQEKCSIATNQHKIHGSPWYQNRCMTHRVSTISYDVLCIIPSQSYPFFLRQKGVRAWKEMPFRDMRRIYRSRILLWLQTNEYSKKKNILEETPLFAAITADG